MKSLRCTAEVRFLGYGEKGFYVAYFHTLIIAEL